MLRVQHSVWYTVKNLKMLAIFIVLIKALNLDMLGELREIKNKKGQCVQSTLGKVEDEVGEVNSADNEAL